MSKRRVEDWKLFRFCASLKLRLRISFPHISQILRLSSIKNGIRIMLAYASRFPVEVFRMSHCIFCQSELTDSTTYEHILPNALGGRKTTRRVICSDCNNVFGGSIDKSLTSQVDVIRNLLQLKSGTGKAPPMLRKIQSGTETVNFRNDGTPESTGKPFAIDIQDDGSAMVQIKARSAEELQKLIPHIAAQLKISVDEVEEKVKSADVSQITQPLDGVHHRLSFGGIEALRSITKSCLVLWGTVVGNEEINSSPYDDARGFVTLGDGQFNKCRVHLDSRCLPCDSDLQDRFGDIFNLVYLKSDAAGRLIGHFTMYNAVGWQIVLTESGAVPDVGVGLVSNLSYSPFIGQIQRQFKLQSWSSGRLLHWFVSCRQAG